MNLLVSIDWFQIGAELGTEVPPRLGDKFRGSVPCGAVMHPTYTIEAGKEFSPQYRESVAVCLNRVPVAHMFSVPLHGHPRHVLFKAANRLLYMRSWLVTFYDIIRVLGCYRTNVSRLDLCGDFNTFANGLHPAEFISRYFAAPSGERPSYIRHGSNKFRTFGQKNTYKDGRAPVCDFQTLSFGTRDCAVQTNLYNKTEELRKKSKPWIQAAWRAAGLDAEDVWRVEFSCTARGLSIHNFRSSMIEELSVEELSVQSYLTDAFLCYARSFFAFHEYHEGDSRGIRSLPLATLFDAPSELVLKPCGLSLARSCGRSERVCYRLLEKLYYSLSSDRYAPEDFEAIDRVMKLLDAESNVKKALSKVKSPAPLLEMWSQVRAAADDRDLARAYGERLHRVVQYLLISDSPDMKAYADCFDDFFYRLGLDKLVPTAFTGARFSSAPTPSEARRMLS